MVSDSATLVDLLEKSRILSQAQLQEARKLLEGIPDAHEAARRLADTGLITAWQADQLLRGQSTLQMGDGQYTLLDEVPGWPFGRCLLGDSPSSGPVFIKLLSTRWIGTGASEKSLLTVIGKLSRLDEPGLLVFSEAGRAGQRLFVVSRAPSTNHLGSALSQWGAPSPRAVLRIVRQLAQALRAVHQRGVAHGLLRAECVWRDAEGGWWLADAGLGPVVRAWLSEAANRASVAEILPPDGSGIEVPSPRADGFALGKLIVRCLLCDTRGQVEPPPFWREGGKDEQLFRELNDMAQHLLGSVEGQPALDVDTLLQRCEELWHRCTPATDVAAPLQESVGDKAPEKAATHELSVVQRALEKNISPAEQTVADAVACHAERTPSDVESEQAVDSAGGESAQETLPKQAAPSPAVPPMVSTTISIRIEPKRRKQHKKGESDRKTSAETAGGSDSVVEDLPQTTRHHRNPRRLLIASLVGVFLVMVVMPTVYIVTQRQRTVATQPAKQATRTATRQGAQQPVARQTGSSQHSTEQSSTATLPESPPDLQAQAGAEPAAAAGSSSSGVSSGLASGATAEADPPTAPASTQPSATQAMATKAPAEQTPPTETKTPANAAKGQPSAANSAGATATESSRTETPSKSATAETTPEKPSRTESAPPPPPKTVTAVLDQFPQTVQLPPVASQDVTVLASVPVDDELIVFIDLIGGEHVARDVKFTLENAEGGTHPRKWDVYATARTGTASRRRTGQFTLLGGQFTYQWLADSSQVPSAGALSNCRLRVRTGAEIRTVALRKPQIVKPLEMDLDRGTFSERYDVPSLPDAAVCRFEVLKIEGTNKPYQLEPPGSVPAASGKQWVLLGEKRPDQSLAIHLTCTLRGTLMVSGTAIFQMGEDPSDEWLKGRDRKVQKAVRVRLAKELPQAVEVAKQKVAQLSAIDARRIADQNQRQAFEREKNLAQQDLQKLERQWKQVQEVEQLCAAMHGKGIHFRIVFELEGQQVELVRTEGSP